MIITREYKQIHLKVELRPIEAKEYQPLDQHMEDLECIVLDKITEIYGEDVSISCDESWLDITGQDSIQETFYARIIIDNYNEGLD